MSPRPSHLTSPLSSRCFELSRSHWISNMVVGQACCSHIPSMTSGVPELSWWRIVISRLLSETDTRGISRNRGPLLISPFRDHPAEVRNRSGGIFPQEQVEGVWQRTAAANPNAMQLFAVTWMKPVPLYINLLPASNCTIPLSLSHILIRDIDCASKKGFHGAVIKRDEEGRGQLFHTRNILYPFTVFTFSKLLPTTMMHVGY